MFTNTLKTESTTKSLLSPEANKHTVKRQTTFTSTLQFNQFASSSPIQSPGIKSHSNLMSPLIYPGIKHRRTLNS